MAFAFTPSNAENVAIAYGVDNTLANYIIQNLTESSTTQNLEIPDQKGRICQIVAYDTQKTLTFTAIGPTGAPCEVGDVLAIADGAISVKADAAAAGDWIVQTVERACTYNDTAKWNVTATSAPHAKPFNKTDDDLDSPITNG